MSVMPLAVARPQHVALSQRVTAQYATCFNEHESAVPGAAVFMLPAAQSTSLLDPPRACISPETLRQKLARPHARANLHRSVKGLSFKYRLGLQRGRPS